MEKGRDQPQVSDAEIEDLKKAIYKPLEHYQIYRNEIVAGTVSPSYILPIHALQRLEKIMDEYVGGISVNYMTNEPLLTRGLELLGMLKEDARLPRRRRPSPASARLGAAAPAAGVRVRHPAHPVPQGNAVAGLLLSGRLSEARRQRLALLHPVPLRPGFGEVGDGEGSRLSHRELMLGRSRQHGFRSRPACSHGREPW